MINTGRQSCVQMSFKLLKNWVFQEVYDSGFVGKTWKFDLLAGAATHRGRKKVDSGEVKLTE